MIGDSEVIGIELEVEAVEKDVGPFRADILARDTATGLPVLIENQLEGTDHRHLGQLLTYTAGLQAATIVWIAKSFTQEHRAALDWLNTSTATNLNFFGLEIELWRIGGSDLAPKLNVVSQPNDWAKLVKERGADGASGLTDLQRLQLDYWTELQALLEQRGGRVRIKTASPQAFLNFSVGRTGFNVVAWNFMTQAKAGAVIDGSRPNSAGKA